MRRLLFMALSLLMISSQLLAQDRAVHGKVVDERGNGIPSISVQLKGTKRGTVTSTDGSFSISVPASGKSLVISGTGYTAKEVSIQDNMTVTLQEESKSLDEIVVVGFEVKRKRDVAGAVTSVKAAQIADKPTLSIDKGIQGRMAGVQIINNNGVPGGSATVRIRGIGSLQAGNQPLFIIDGIQVTSGDQTRNFPSSNALAQLNPDDIESIDVLKDPASASIYGAQAANGVVIITTKRGKNSPKTKVTVNSSYGVAQVLHNVPVLTGPQIAQLSYEAYLNRYGKATADNFLTSTFKGSVDSVTTFDWQKAIFRNAKLRNIELAVSGGNDKTKFYLSGGLNKSEGIVIHSDFKRTSLKFNLDHKINNKLTLSTSLNGSSFLQNGVQGGSDFANPQRGGILLWPGSSPYNADGSYNTNLFGTYYVNPIRLADYNTYNARTNKALGNIALTYAITPHFTFRSSFNTEYTNIKETQFFDPRTEYGATNNGELYLFNTEAFDWQTDQTLNFNQSFGKHNISALAGFQYRKYQYNTFDASGKNFPTYQFQTLGSAAAPNNVGGTYTTYRLAGVFGKASYIYDNRYILSATLRRDGSSRFGTNTQFGYFPSVALAWRASNESFLKSSNVINDLKVRASYGITGNSLIANFGSKGLVGLSGEYLGTSGLSVTQFPSRDLSWEQNRSYNFGVDFGVLKNRISGSVDYFVANRERLLLNKPIPGTNGLTSVLENVGTLKNKGVEVELSLRIIDKKDLTVTLNGNYTYTTNKLTKLLNGQTQLDVATVVGKPLNQIFTYQYAGVNPANGLPMWYDTLGNVTYITKTRDRVYIGGLDPKYYGGFGGNVTFKNFEFSILFQYSGGNMALNQDAIFASRSGSTVDRNQYASQIERWTHPGQATAVPKPYFGGSVSGLTSSFYALSNRFYEDGSYVRLKDLTLAYNIPSSILKRIKFDGARFYVNATNLYTWTKYQGYDVEFVNTSGDFGNYPQSRQIIAGLQLNF